MGSREYRKSCRATAYRWERRWCPEDPRPREALRRPRRRHRRCIQMTKGGSAPSDDRPSARRAHANALVNRPRCGSEHSFARRGYFEQAGVSKPFCDWDQFERANANLIGDRQHVPGAVAVGDEIHHGAHIVGGAVGANRGIEAALAELWLTQDRHSRHVIGLDHLEAGTQRLESALKARRRNQRKIIERGVVLGVDAVFRAHDRGDRQIDAGAAILTLVAAAIQKTIERMARGKMTQDVARRAISQCTAVARGNKSRSSPMHVTT